MHVTKVKINKLKISRILQGIRFYTQRKDGVNISNV